MDNSLANNFHNSLMHGRKGPSAGSRAYFNTVTSGGTDLGALYRTFTKINSIFSILFEMRRPRTLYKRTFVVEVNCTLKENLTRRGRRL